eukprot:CAMPEP_0206220620 /NCGR_PEP_ID=MMETSP0047_2-20121206/4978_1 /ASSEMBLY_ACC=CAM_ASM_000192 /TAXON_ID=195065 /ORGANISM="Chroomonas mesostigmatica_cf, Strain CCMP1168" /LENGTH=131 /DNA_ID=CAMNT_0053643299 /DNA_START=158 /DNA_END=554 /DNA_ORIENTATION=-
MDADWGSSSDDEDAAERARKDAEKLNETMALLDAFKKTEEVKRENYGSAGERFRAERAQAAGKAMWSEKQGRVQQEQHELQEIRSGMKWHIGLGLIIIVVLSFALLGFYKQFNESWAAAPQQLEHHAGRAH